MSDTVPMCPSLIVDSRGRVTIPDNIRRAYGIEAGSEIDIVELRKCLEC